MSPSMPAGSVIVRENEPAETLYMIVAGKVRLSFETTGAFSGPGVCDDNALIRTLTEAGRIIGWSALVEPYFIIAPQQQRSKTHICLFS